MLNISPTLSINKHLYLRKPEVSDIESRFSYGRPIEFRKMCGGDTRSIPPFTKQDAERWYDKIVNRRYEWIIVYNKKMIGTTRLVVGTSDKGSRFSIGIFDESLYSKGLGTSVTKAILDYAFSELKLHRVELVVLEYNKRGIQCYKKCGFKQEGVLRDTAFIDGEFHNDIILSILKSEYDRSVTYESNN